MSRYSASAVSEKRGRSVITLAPDHVDLPERRDDVRDHAALEHLPERAHAVERRRPHADAVGAAADCAHEVEPGLAVRPLRGDVDLARGNLLSLDDELEVVHQALDRGVDLALRREEPPRIGDRDRALGDLLERLLDDP